MGITSWTDVNGVPTPVYSSSSTNATAITDNLIVDADVNSAAAIAYSKLALTGHIVNADVAANAAVAYSKLSLGTSIVNADVAANAAVAYSKLNLGTSIVNADVASGAAIATSKLATGTSGYTLNAAGSGVPTFEAPDNRLCMPTGALAEVASRRDGNWSSQALAATTGQMCFQAIILHAGMVISNITFLSASTTAASGATHCWFCLTDKNRVQVATTTDDTSATPWAINTAKTLAIATIASGASGTYTVPTTDLYYLGYNLTASTMCLGMHQAGGNANLWGTVITPILAGTGETISTGPPAFAKTYSSFTAVAKMIYGYVS